MRLHAVLKRRSANFVDKLIPTKYSWACRYGHHIFYIILAVTCITPQAASVIGPMLSTCLFSYAILSVSKNAKTSLTLNMHISPFIHVKVYSIKV